MADNVFNADVIQVDTNTFGGVVSACEIQFRVNSDYDWDNIAAYIRHYCAGKFDTRGISIRLEYNSFYTYYHKTTNEEIVQVEDISADVIKTIATNVNYRLKSFEPLNLTIIGYNKPATP